MRMLHHYIANVATPSKDKWEARDAMGFGIACRLDYYYVIVILRYSNKIFKLSFNAFKIGAYCFLSITYATYL
jgi:hypothetical protein